MAENTTKTSAKKVGPGSVEEPKKEKKAKKKRLAFDPKSCPDILDENGKLTAVPESWDGKEFKPIPKGMFASEVIHIRFQATVADANAARLTARAADLRDKADKLEKFGDAATRKKALKLEKMKAQLEKLQAELAESGVTID